MDLALTLLGFGLILLGSLLILLAAYFGQMKVRGGGLILIGPIPIMFGDKSPGVILLAIMLLVLIFLILLMFMAP